jgi:hypothetical protein
MWHCSHGAFGEHVWPTPPVAETQLHAGFSDEGERIFGYSTLQVEESTKENAATHRYLRNLLGKLEDALKLARSERYVRQDVERTREIAPLEEASAESGRGALHSPELYTMLNDIDARVVLLDYALRYGNAVPAIRPFLQIGRACFENRPSLFVLPRPRSRTTSDVVDGAIGISRHA